MSKKPTAKNSVKKEKNRFFKLNKKVLLASIAVLLIAIVAGAAYWLWPRGYSLLDKYEKFEANASYSQNPPNSLISGGKVYPSQYYITYDKSVFKPELADKGLEEGVSIHPNISGQWYIAGDRIISFTPTVDWIPNTKYSVKLDKKLFSSNVNVKEKDFTFHSPEFKANVTNSSFYEDPRDTKLKQAVASFTFNYPIENKDIKDKIKVTSVSGEKYDFTYKFDEVNKNAIHVISEALKIKQDEDFVDIRVKGVKNAYNNEAMKGEAKAQVKIPSQSTFFKLNNVNSYIVNNENDNNNPEQILFVGFSTAVKLDSLKQYLDVYSYSASCYEVKEEMSKKKDMNKLKWKPKKIEITEVNPEVMSAKTHLFKYDIDGRGKCLMVNIKRGMSSVDDFIFTNDEQQFIDAAVYPLQANIGFSGSLLSLSGDKKVSFTSRGVDKITAQVARIGIEDLNHLVTQTYGNFSNPRFQNYNFNEENISEIFQKDLPINMTHPAKENYSSLDFSDYFKKERGIFLLTIKGSLENKYYTYEDKRLIVISDLGVIVKDNVDKTHDLFVSSFADEKPIARAKIEVLGKNGLPVLSTSTNSEGFARFPNFENFTKDKQPVVYMISKGNDFSFMPINKSDRRLDYSRFNVDGVYTDSNDQDTLTGMVFSDRGIYRPGEKASFGAIVRQKDLNVPKKMPLQITIRNSTYDEVATAKVTSDKYGFFDYQYDVPKNAKIGDYRIYLDEIIENKTPRLITSASFRVEEFVPDTMKIKLTLEDVSSKGWYIKDDLKATISLQNLYGNPASHHKIAASYILSPTSFYFSQYNDFSFSDPLRADNSYVKHHSETLSNTETNEEGISEYLINLNNVDKGTYGLTFKAEGYELDSGRSVSTSSSTLVSPNKYLVGYRTGGDLGYITKNAEIKVDFIAIDNTLKQIALNDLKLSRYEVKYISTLMEMPNGTYRYQMVEKQEKLSENNYSISEKGSEVVLDASKPGEFYIKIEDKDGKVFSKVDYSVIGASNTSYKIDREAILDLKLNKTEYNHGDEIMMQLKAPYAGYGLITIEQDKVYAYKWFKSDSKVSEQSIKLPSNVEGNAYINIAYVRSPESSEIFASPLSYAMQSFSINKEKRSVKIELGVPEVVRPGDELVVNYKTSEPAKIVVYGVNQGILQVADYKLPDPLAYFMKKRALRVVTYQIMDLIMPDSKIVRDLKAAGGDDASAMTPAPPYVNPFSRKQDEVVAFWSGVIDADTSPKQYSFKVPETFNGQITVMAVSVNQNKFGNAEEKTLIRGDFALTTSGPFNVSPNDVFEVGTSVANLVEGSGDNYKVKVEVEAGDGLEIIGERSKTVVLKEGGEASVRFNAKALSKLGSTTLNFTASAVDDQTKVSKMPYHIGVRPSNPYTVDLNMGYEPSKLKLTNFALPMFEEFREQEIIASTSPLMLTEGLLKFLDKFPHGCTEQTVSKAFPTMEIFFKYPKLVEGFDIYKLFDNAITTLSLRQNLDGGFTTWGVSGTGSNEFASIYSTHFLVKAKGNNFNVPHNLFNKAINYNKDKASKNPSSLDDTNPAYAIYVLTLNGETTTNYLINLENFYEENYKKEWKKSLSAAYMAASYKMLQDEAKAGKILGSYKLGQKDNSLNDSRYIYLIASHFPDDFKGLKEDGIRALLEPLKTSNFTTISSAYSILALNAYQDDKTLDEKIKFSGFTANYDLFASLPFNDEVKKLDVTSPNPFFYSVNQQGFLKDSDPKEIKQGIEVYKEYQNKDGKVINSAKIGDEIIVKIKIRSLGKDYINDVAIIDLIPGCFEIKSRSIAEGSYKIDYSEEREDRALIYLPVTTKLKEVSYKAKVIAKGEFVVPPVYATALYDALIKANSKASKIDVKE